MATETTHNGAFLLPLALGADFIRAHADGVEIAVTPGSALPTGDDAALVRTVHLPFERTDVRLNFADPDPAVREADLDWILRSIVRAQALRPARYVIHPTGLRRWKGRAPGEWDVLVTMLRRLADDSRAARTGPLVIENNRTYWNDIADATPVGHADRSQVNRCFGETPAEWSQLQTDVDRDDVLLCLDLSHATTSAHLYATGAEREDCLREFLSHRDRIVHVHWSDNFLMDARGRTDSHAFPGKGTLPAWFHRAVRGLNATFMFEVDPDPAAVSASLAFIRSL